MTILVVITPIDFMNLSWFYPTKPLESIHVLSNDWVNLPHFYKVLESLVKLNKLIDIRFPLIKFNITQHNNALFLIEFLLQIFEEFFQIVEHLALSYLVTFD